MISKRKVTAKITLPPTLKIVDYESLQKNVEVPHEVQLAISFGDHTLTQSYLLPSDFAEMDQHWKGKAHVPLFGFLFTATAKSLFYGLGFFGLLLGRSRWYMLRGLPLEIDKDFATVADKFQERFGPIRGYFFRGWCSIAGLLLAMDNAYTQGYLAIKRQLKGDEVIPVTKAEEKPEQKKKTYTRKDLGF